MSALSDLLNKWVAEKFEGRPSNRHLAELAGVSRGTVDNYLKGVVVRPTEDVLQAFHKLLGIPIQELREVAGLPRGEADPYTPPSEANLLSRRQRDTLDAFIRAVVEDGARSGMETTPEPRAQGEASEDEKTEPGSLDKPQQGRADASAQRLSGRMRKAPQKDRKVE